MIKLQEGEISEKSTKINAEKDSKVSEIAKLRNDEGRVSEGIEKDVIFKFERIIRSKQGKGIVSVRGYVCNGCHMILPAQFCERGAVGQQDHLLPLLFPHPLL